jgi:hypothetical protein
MCRGLCVTYKTGLGLDDWIYCTLSVHNTQDYRQYRTIAIIHTLQFAVAHALGFSVFTSHSLAMDLSQPHCYFKSLVKSCHSLVPFLPLFCSCQFQRLDSIRFLCSQAHILAGWHLETQLFTPRLLFSTRSASSVSFYNPLAQTPRKTLPVLLMRRVYCAIA